MQKPQGNDLFMDNTQLIATTHCNYHLCTISAICVLWYCDILQHAAIYCTYDIDNSKTAVILILHIVILRTGNNVVILP